MWSVSFPRSITYDGPGPGEGAGSGEGAGDDEGTPGNAAARRSDAERRARIRRIFGDPDQSVTSDELREPGEGLDEAFWRDERPPHW